MISFYLANATSGGCQRWRTHRRIALWGLSAVGSVSDENVSVLPADKNKQTTKGKA